VNDQEIVADASAVLALLKQEPFGQFDPGRLLGALVSSVNLTEVLEKLCSGGLSEPEASRAVAALGLQIVAFDEVQARIAARLRPQTRHVGLSLADRACLALGLRVGKLVVTADRVWAQLDIGVQVLLIR
jgi:PIN domain nuclease of toxin-antitoxin system